MTSAALQLSLENSLRSAITTAALLPSVGIQSAHAMEKATAADYLFIIADLPDWDTLGGINAILRVTFQLVTSVADPDPRSTQAGASQDRLGALIDFLSPDNFDAARDALNAAGLAENIGFTGWEGPLPQSEDGQDDANKQLAPKLVYEFEIFRL